MTEIDYGPDPAAMRRRIVELEEERDRLRAKLAAALDVHLDDYGDGWSHYTRCAACSSGKGR